jgi:hypothetical protein
MPSRPDFFRSQFGAHPRLSAISPLADYTTVAMSLIRILGP